MKITFESANESDMDALLKENLEEFDQHLDDSTQSDPAYIFIDGHNVIDFDRKRGDDEAARTRLTVKVRECARLLRMRGEDIYFELVFDTSGASNVALCEAGFKVVYRHNDKQEVSGASGADAYIVSSLQKLQAGSKVTIYSNDKKDIWRQAQAVAKSKKHRLSCQSADKLYDFIAATQGRM